MKRKYRAPHDYIHIRVLKEPEKPKSNGGIIIPYETDKLYLRTGEIVSIGRHVDYAMGYKDGLGEFKVGDIVKFRFEEAMSIADIDDNVFDDSLRAISWRGIYGIVDENNNTEVKHE